MVAVAKIIREDTLGVALITPRGCDKRGGFSLLELIVVMGILALLAIGILANYTTSQRRARDTERKSDLRQIQKAIELYRQDNNSCPATGWSALESALEPDYMREVPEDPQGGTYDYTMPRVAGDNYTYQIYACLEDITDEERDGDDGSGDDLCGGADGRVSYTVIEP